MMAGLLRIELRNVRLVKGYSLALVVRSALATEESAAPARRRAVGTVLRSVLAMLAGRPPESIRFEKAAEGKPYLAGGSGIAFNLSHSRRYSLIALSLSGEVGCDIEDRFTDEDVAGLCPLILHPAELEAMHRLAAQDRQDALRRYWVRKEAVLKATGSGFLSDPRNLITGQEDRQARWTAQAGPSFSIHNQLVEPGCVAAVASMDPVCIWHLLRT